MSKTSRNPEGQFKSAPEINKTTFSITDEGYSNFSIEYFNGDHLYLILNHGDDGLLYLTKEEGRNLIRWLQEKIGE